MTIKLVTFDLDNTLWAVGPVLARAELLTEEWLNRHAPLLSQHFDREALMTRRAELWQQRPELRHRISDLRREGLRLALLDSGYPASTAAELAERAFAVFLQARRQVTLFPEADSVLAQLQRLYRLAAITNGNACVRAAGLGHRFAFQLAAEDVGAGKPAPALFEAALKQAAVAAHEAVHVGDHPHDDIHGAREVGMHAIWYDPEGSVWPEELAPHDQRISSLNELPALIQRLAVER